LGNLRIAKSGADNDNKFLVQMKGLRNGRKGLSGTEHTSDEIIPIP
jgi:hypothetical protein